MYFEISTGSTFAVLPMVVSKAIYLLEADNPTLEVNEANMNVPANAVAVAVKPNGATQPAQPTYAELLAKIAALETAAKAPKDAIDFVIADKGGVSATGFGRFPTTLYYEQWVKLLDAADRQGLRLMLAQWLSEGRILLKAASKEETLEARKARSIVRGQADLAALTGPAAK